ncbi:MAG: decaprenyl-phosphate phosphoribosyltransferase [bacterium]|nr:decaprenyl-phosphate phosphoribosyltransferase [bacterium]
MQKIIKTIIYFLKSMRLYQWVKNTFIFAPVIFSLHFLHLNDISYIKNSLLAFFLFSLVTGSIYILNDCFDKKKDMVHPEKCKRPIASGQLPVLTAAIGAGILTLVALTAIYLFNFSFFIISIIYILMNISYSTYLKRVVILDVMVIAIGFVLRVKIGGDINDITLSVWILIITFLLAIFLALIKRRQELVKMKSVEGKTNTRKTLKEYNLPLLDQLISITTATTVISYIIYVTNPDIQQKFGTKELYLTVPFVIFGVFRYMFLTYAKGKGESPSEILFSDIPTFVNIIIWLTFFVLLIRY